MAELFLLNPRRRRRKMTAKQRKYFGGKRRARRNPTRRRARRNPLPIMATANPRRHRRRRRVHRNPSHRRRHYRSNPAMRLTGRGIVNQVTDAATGAAGATVVDVVMGYLNPNLPATFLSPNVYPIVKGAVAIGLGAVGQSMGGQAGRFFAKGAEGSLICTLHDVFRSFVPAGISLGYINSGYVPAHGNMGAYVRGVRTPLMGVRTPLMGLGQPDPIESAMSREMNLYGPGYQAMGAYVR